jgi:hypothetical protein
MNTFKVKLSQYVPQWVFIPAILVVFFTLTYCTERDSKARKSVNELKEYVETSKTKTDSTIDEHWDRIEREYSEKKSEAERYADKMETELKESYNKAVKDWEEYKAEIREKQELRQKEKDARLLRSSLAPAGILPDLSNVTAANIRGVYEHFFEVVENNKETYSKEQWINVNNYWQSLNDIKDRLDKSKAVSDADNRKIRGIKAKYAATKALNKPFSQSEKYQ